MSFNSDKKGWKNCTLGDVVTFKRGFDLSKDKMVEGQYPVIGSSGIIGYHNEFTTKAPGITIGRSGHGVGRVFMIDKYSWSHNTTLFIENFKDVDPLFIYYLLKNMDLKHYAGGSAIPTLNRNHIHSIDIKIPKEISEQKDIAKILYFLDIKIELNEKVNNNLLKISYKLFEEWFLNFEFPNENQVSYKSNGGEFKETEQGLIPLKWETGILADIIEFKNGYSFKSGDLLNKEEANTYPIFKMGNILKGGGFNYSATKSWIKKEDAINLDKYLIKKGDLLMCMTDMKGNVALLGHTALMDEDDLFLLNQRVGLLRASNNLGIKYPYLYLLTNHNTFLSNLRGRANSGVQVNLSTKAIKESSIVIPTKDVNIKFNNIVEPIFEKIFFNNFEIRKLQKLRDTLLPRLMSGEIDVSKINCDLD